MLYDHVYSYSFVQRLTGDTYEEHEQQRVEELQKQFIELQDQYCEFDALADEWECIVCMTLTVIHVVTLIFLTTASLKHNLFGFTFIYAQHLPSTLVMIIQCVGEKEREVGLPKQYQTERVDQLPVKVRS